MKTRFLAVALAGLLFHAAAGAAETPATAAAPQTSAMLRSAVQILKQEQRSALRKNLHADWSRMSAALAEEARALQVAGGPANPTVKAGP